MARFDVGDRVLWRDDGGRHRGRVTEVMRGSCRVVSDNNRREVVSTRRLMPSPNRVLILEGRLDRSLSKAERIYGEMWQRWLEAYDAEVLYERVHSKVDLRRFLRREGRDARTRIVHIISHGKAEDRGRRIVLRLTHETVDLAADKEIFQGLRGKILLFSSCDVGANESLLRGLKAESGAGAIIAYRKGVFDASSNVAEVLMYQCFLETNWSPKTVVAKVEQVLRDLEIRLTDEPSRRSVLVCV